MRKLNSPDNFWRPLFLNPYTSRDTPPQSILWREREWNIRVVVEQPIQISPTRFRVPDVTVLDRAQPVEQTLNWPPLIAIEVLSPKDTWSRMEERIADYPNFRIPNVWVLDAATPRLPPLRGAVKLTTTLEVAGSPIPIARTKGLSDIQTSFCPASRQVFLA